MVLLSIINNVGGRPEDLILPEAHAEIVRFSTPARKIADMISNLREVNIVRVYEVCEPIHSINLLPWIEKNLAMLSSKNVSQDFIYDEIHNLDSGIWMSLAKQKILYYRRKNKYGSIFVPDTKTVEQHEMLKKLHFYSLQIGQSLLNVKTDFKLSELNPDSFMRDIKWTSDHINMYNNKRIMEHVNDPKNGWNKIDDKMFIKQSPDS